MKTPIEEMLSSVPTAESNVAIRRRLRAATDLPLWIKPNAGSPEILDEHLQYRESPQPLPGHVRDLVAAGTSFVGGCCGTTPAFIRELSTSFGSAERG